MTKAFIIGALLLGAAYLFFWRGQTGRMGMLVLITAGGVVGFLGSLAHTGVNLGETLSHAVASIGEFG